ncbi:3-keto-L-gulonate-6-phosphate decarboxylase SgbH, partial [Haemophilus influenzae]
KYRKIRFIRYRIIYYRRYYS